MLVNVKFLLMLDTHCAGEGSVSFQPLDTEIEDRRVHLEFANNIAKSVNREGGRSTVDV